LEAQEGQRLCGKQPALLEQKCGEAERIYRQALARGSLARASEQRRQPLTSVRRGERLTYLRPSRSIRKKRNGNLKWLRPCGRRREGARAREYLSASTFEIRKLEARAEACRVGKARRGVERNRELRDETSGDSRLVFLLRIDLRPDIGGPTTGQRRHFKAPVLVQKPGRFSKSLT